MKLQDRLPDGVEVDGKFYKLDFEFRNVLRMIEVLDQKNLMPEAKAYNALKLFEIKNILPIFAEKSQNGGSKCLKRKSIRIRFQIKSRFAT